MTKYCSGLMLVALAAMGSGMVPAAAADTQWTWGISVNDAVAGSSHVGMKAQGGAPGLRAVPRAGDAARGLGLALRPGSTSAFDRMVAEAASYLPVSAGLPAFPAANLARDTYVLNADIYGVWPIRRDVSLFAAADLHLMGENGAVAGQSVATAASSGSTGLRVSSGVGLGLELSVSRNAALRSTLRGYRWSAGESTAGQTDYMFSLGADIRF
jgi:hypothetical protein